MRTVKLTLEQFKNGVRKEPGFVVRQLDNTIDYSIGQIMTEMEVRGLLKDETLQLTIVGAKS